MAITRKTSKLLITLYFSMLVIFFFLSILQEVIITKHVFWSNIFPDYLVDTIFLTIAFSIFYILLKKLQERLNIIKEQEQRYRHVLDNMMEGIQILSHDWKYEYLNDAAVSQSHYTREELIGSSIIERYPGVEHTELFNHMQRCMQEKITVNIENQFIYPDGASGFF